MLFFLVFVHPEPRKTKLHLRRPSGFGLFGACPGPVGKIPTRSESTSLSSAIPFRPSLFPPSPYILTSLLPYLLFDRHRDEKPVTATPLVSALSPCRSHRDAPNSFRMRFYENCRVSLGPILPLLKFYLNLPLSHPGSFFSSTYKLPISQALCFDIHASDGGCRGVRPVLRAFQRSNVPTCKRSSRPRRPTRLPYRAPHVFPTLSWAGACEPDWVVSPHASLSTFNFRLSTLSYDTLCRWESCGGFHAGWENKTR